ncbi:hypothetical protein B5V88_10760 [Heyndrickxia sporothermodurans]|uniref:Uncharacterized protein n=1 Tax=Heyndrickxia sporothermodurans TaxID=46224 RepID=A0AB37HPQ2_9BACI|nr:hypothetical protein [Heyndrickxia sporothermodurans]MBL5771655.1 hypothetical protein [Heyndrickxia sporothermodurans]MBL5832876.1 hypothetical protein [Heyndrickxia sporothermodurans]MED3652841.1 hypothetical protein [Heyndrickxia sporothermodurans]PTY77226.1 hypothetical protein B5V88_10760 [Heyndrickxia sporothermodurans]PTY86532.1 hypothetical protein B5V91_05440 [Heyndrickxia sporothermodurans]
MLRLSINNGEASRKTKQTINEKEIQLKGEMDMGKKTKQNSKQKPKGKTSGSANGQNGYH